MQVLNNPSLSLQPDLLHRPYGGAWWPSGGDLSHELLDLVAVWPVDRASITGYTFLPTDWDVTNKETLSMYRTRTLVLRLADRTACRILLIPAETPAPVARELLAEASSDSSRWKRVDFESTFRAPVPHEHQTLNADGSDR